MARWSRRISGLVLALCLVDVGCGGGSYSPPAQPSPQPVPGQSSQANMQGAWEFVFQSDVVPDRPTVLEMNLSQSGTHISADSTAALAFQGEGSGTWALTIDFARFGGKCDNAGTDEVAFDGTLSDERLITQPVTFTITESGSSGNAVMTGTATVTNNGAISIKGTYSLPAACGLPEDHGVFEGFQDTTKFSILDSYSGSFAGHNVVVRFASDSTSYLIAASGTDNSRSFSLTGSTVGLALKLTGSIAGQAITWFGLFDSTYNTIRIYDSHGTLLGTLGNS